MREQTKGAIYMAVSAVFFSIGGVFIKMIPWGPFAINGVRCLIAAAVFGLYMLAVKKKPVMNLPTFLGSLGIIGTTVLFNVATKFTTAGNAIILEYTSPVFIILLTYLFFRKKPSKADLIAAILVIFGIFWFFLDSLSTGHYLGDFLGICSAMAVSIVYVLKLHPRADMASLIFFGLVFSGVLCIPFLSQETEFSLSIWGYATALGALQLGLAYILFFFGLSRCNPVPAVLAGTLEPILNPVWVALFYGEVISLLALPGVIVVLGTVLVYNIYTAKKE